MVGWLSVGLGVWFSELKIKKLTTKDADEKFEKPSFFSKKYDFRNIFETFEIFVTF